MPYYPLSSLYIDPLSDILLQVSGCPGFIARKENPKTMDPFFPDSQFFVWFPGWFLSFPEFADQLFDQEVRYIDSFWIIFWSVKWLIGASDGWIPNQVPPRVVDGTPHTNKHRVAVCWHFIWTADIVVDAWCDETNIEEMHLTKVSTVRTQWMACQIDLWLSQYLASHDQTTLRKWIAFIHSTS